MSASTAHGLKYLIEAVDAANGDPSAARQAICSLRSELDDLEQLGEQLARTEESLLQLRKAFDEAPIGMAVLATNGRFLRVNAALSHLLGYSAEELAAMTLGEVTHCDDRAIDSTDANRLWAGECSSYAVQKRYVRKDQRTVTARLTASVLRDESGEPLYGLAIFEVTQALSEADWRLRRSEQRWELLCEVSENGLWDWVPGTDEMYWSPQLTRMLGYADGEITPSVAAFNALIHPDDHACAWGTFDEHAAGKTAVCRSEFRLRAKDGTYRWIESRGKASFDEGGHVVRMVGLHTDVTSRRNLVDTASIDHLPRGSLDLVPSSAHCARCKSDLLVRSRWRLWEWPLLLLLQRPVRCRACGRRAFKPLWARVPGRVD